MLLKRLTDSLKAVLMKEWKQAVAGGQENVRCEEREKKDLLEIYYLVFE